MAPSIKDQERHDPNTTVVQAGQRAPRADLFEPEDELLDGRILILDRLGQGGMGVVYRALDRTEGSIVALKTLTTTSSKHIAHLKQEFRSLAAVVHPNVIGLHELLVDGGRWFFTMDLVEGRGLLRSVWGVSHDARTTLRVEDSLHGSAATAASPPILPGVDEATVRDVFRQLAEGVSAIHQCGQLHRDLKPSNVMVDTARRVIVLDFGLAVPLEPPKRTRSGRTEIAGTPAYMAPEQVLGRPATPASDWYAVGSMLYEVLTGGPPFGGSTATIIDEKTRSVPPPPDTLVPGLPRDLVSLCVRLLDRSPEARPTSQEIREAFGAVRSGPVWESGSVSGGPPFTDETFVGRNDELAALRAAYHRVTAGEPVALFLHGESGSGKTRLVQYFFDALQAEGTQPLVLQGRCYEREAVPFKAFDAIVDALYEYLDAIPGEHPVRKLPADLSALVPVFPVLEPLAPRTTKDVSLDAQDSRTRAFAAMKELLFGIATDRPLILYVDDLQWGDVDGAELLSELLQPPDAPPLLFIGSYRTADGPASPFLQRLRSLERMDRTVPLEWLELLPLDEDASAQLVRLLSGENLDEAAAAEIARESRGNPFLASELTRYAQSVSGTGSMTGARPPSLTELLRLRYQKLQKEEQRLLDAVALSGRPIAQRLALAAAGVDSSTGAVAALRAARLVRTRGVRGDDAVECYHDRIRETVSDRIAPAHAAELHLALAETLEQDANEDAAEAITQHYVAAGLRERAGPFAASAAARAAEALAFERAARLYALAAELAPSSEDRHDLLVQRGQALVGAGNEAEAAEVFLTVAATAPAERSLELTRLAAEQLLRTGHYERGRNLMRTVAVAHGLPYPEDDTSTYLALIQRALRLRARGFFFTPHSPDSVPPRELRALDVCWAAGWAVWSFDPMRFGVFSLEFMLRSLKLGDATLVAKARATYAMSLAVAGPKNYAAAMMHLDAVRDLSADPYTRAYLLLAESAIHIQSYRHRRALACADEAARRFSDDCIGASFEISLAHAFALVALIGLGEFRTLRRRVLVFDRERAHKDKLADLYAASFTATVALLDGADMEAACRRMRKTMGQVPLQAQKDYINITLFTEVAAGHPERAWTHIQKLNARLGWLASRTTMHFSRLENCLRTGQCAIAIAKRESGRKRRRFLHEARASARALERERTAVASAYAALLRAAIADTCGDRHRLAEQLHDADRLFDAVHMPAYRAIAQWRLGQLGNGAAERSAAESFEEMGVRDPELLCRTNGLGE